MEFQFQSLLPVLLECMQLNLDKKLIRLNKLEHLIALKLTIVGSQRKVCTRMAMKENEENQDSYREFENYFKSTSESKLYKKFLRRWADHFPEVVHNEIFQEEEETDDNEEKEEDQNKKQKEDATQPRVPKKVFDHKSKKYVEQC